MKTKDLNLIAKAVGPMFKELDQKLIEQETKMKSCIGSEVEAVYLEVADLQAKMNEAENNPIQMAAIAESTFERNIENYEFNLPEPENTKEYVFEFVSCLKDELDG